MFSKDRLIIVFLPLLILLVEFTIGIFHYFGDTNSLRGLFLAAWMVVWWVFEVLPLGITALLPLFYYPLSGLIPIKDVTPSYSNPVIYLFLGGFIIAKAMEKTNLDERIALNILKKTGRTDQGIVLGFIISTTFLSMWISNTATTVMMVPIAMSVTHFLKSHLKEENLKSFENFQTVLFISIAYAANIGGITTPVGTPPNVVFVGYLDELYHRSVDFYLWMATTTPVAIGLLAIMFFVLRRLFPFTMTLPKDFKEFLNKKIKDLGEVSSQQWVTISVFSIAATLWIFKEAIHWALGISFLNDTSIAVMCGFLLFLIPSSYQSWKPVLDKDDIGSLPWDIVLLFGGGMALADGLKTLGLIEQATNFLGSLDLSSPYWLIFIICALALALTEIMSNVALCVVALPLIMKLGEAHGLDPLLVAMPAALATSFAFSMPISTPPNAIVFGTGVVRVKDMLKGGIILNFFAVLITMTVGYSLIRWLLIA